MLAVVVVATILLMIAFMGVVVLLTACGDTGSGSCDENAARLKQFAGLAILGLVALPWMQFVIRVLRVSPEDDQDDFASTEQSPQAPAQLPGHFPTGQVPLSLGQRLVAGRVESVDIARHKVECHGLALWFWGGHALRQRQIVTGENAAFVYQTLPLFGTRFVLAFWKGGSESVRSVAVLAHAFFFFLGIVGPAIARTVTDRFPVWFVPVTVGLVVESCVYLLLVFRAKRSLHAIIDRSVPS